MRMHRRWLVSALALGAACAGRERRVVRTYALICYVRDGATLPAHSRLGMVAFLHAR